MYCYCLFCETQRCPVISQLLGKWYGVHCISPRFTQRIWKKGTYRDVVKQWLPGYIFLYTEEEIRPRFEISGIIRLVGDGTLKDQDLTFAQTIYDQNGVMGSVLLAEEGERCVIADPVWSKLQGTVVKLDRGRKRCCVAFNFDNQTRTVWVGYDLVQLDKI